jgi:hypothetical protein
MTPAARSLRSFLGGGSSRSRAAVDVYLSTVASALLRGGVDPVSSSTRRLLHAASSAGALDVRRDRAAGRPSPLGLAGASGTVTTTERLLGRGRMMMMHSSSLFSPRSSPTSTTGAGVRGWQPPRLLAGFSVKWARSLSISTPAGQGRFVLDASGKRVRTNSNNVGGGGRGVVEGGLAGGAAGGAAAAGVAVGVAARAARHSSLPN